MAIWQKTPSSKIIAYTQSKIAEAIDKLIQGVIYVGESCVAEARSNGNYIDRTGNLRNSIGYAVLVDSNVVSRRNGKQGSDFLDDLIMKNGKAGEITLIVSAGKNYALYVEAKNYNVLSSAEILAKKIVPKIMKQLGFKER